MCDFVESDNVFAPLEIPNRIHATIYINEEIFSKFLYTSGIPDPDLVIRTSGEQRISNYLLWQIAYSEFYFTNTLWPDFSKEELSNIIENFKTRERRYGKISS